MTGTGARRFGFNVRHRFDQLSIVIAHIIDPRRYRLGGGDRIDRRAEHGLDNRRISAAVTITVNLAPSDSLANQEFMTDQ